MRCFTKPQNLLMPILCHMHYHVTKWSDGYCAVVDAYSQSVLIRHCYIRLNPVQLLYQTMLGRALCQELRIYERGVLSHEHTLRFVFPANISEHFKSNKAGFDKRKIPNPEIIFYESCRMLILYSPNLGFTRVEYEISKSVSVRTELPHFSQGAKERKNQGKGIY